MGRIYQKQPDGSFAPVGALNGCPLLEPTLEYRGLPYTDIFCSPDGNDEYDGLDLDRPVQHIGRAIAIGARVFGPYRLKLRGGKYVSDGIAAADTPVYRLPAYPSSFYKYTSQSAELVNHIQSWDFDSDSYTAGEDVAFIVPPEENSIIDVFIDAWWKGLIFESRNFIHGSAANNRDIRTYFCQSRQMFQDVTLTGAHFDHCQVLFRQGRTILTPGRDTHYCVNIYRHSHVTHEEPITLRFNGNGSEMSILLADMCSMYLNSTDGSCVVNGISSTGLKAHAHANSFLAVGSLINSIPGNNIYVDNSSAIV